MNPIVLEKGENGIKRETITIPIQVKKSHFPGLLKKNGLLEVRITKTTRISVAMDSINQPV